MQLDDKIVFKMKEHFLSVCVTDADTLNTMKIFKKNFNFSLCPHSGSQFDFLLFFLLFLFFFSLHFCCQRYSYLNYLVNAYFSNFQICLLVIFSSFYLFITHNLLYFVAIGVYAGLSTFAPLARTEPFVCVLTAHPAKVRINGHTVCVFTCACVCVRLVVRVSECMCICVCVIGCVRVYVPLKLLLTLS